MKKPQTKLHDESESPHLELEALLKAINTSPINEITNLLDEKLKVNVPELDFYTQIPIWLTSEFKSNIWIYLFDKIEFRLDFNIFLDDGTLLTANKNSKLLKTIKIWLCHQTAPKFNGGNELKANTAQSKVYRCLHFIDKILLNADKFQLSKFGLSLITQDAIISMISDITCLGVAEGVYGYRKKLTSFMKRKIKDISQLEIQNAEVQHPCIIEISQDKSLELDDDEIIKSRVWLLKNNFYKNPKSTSNQGIYDTKALLYIIFPKTLYLHNAKLPIFEELRITEKLIPIEFPRVPVRRVSNNSNKSTEYAKQYLSIFKSIRTLPEKDCFTIPAEQLENVNLEQIVLENVHRNSTQYRTLPSYCVMESINKACDFIERYSLLIRNAVSDILSDTDVQQAILSGIDVQKEINRILIKKLPNQIKDIGVKCWSLKEVGRPSSPNYHFRLRNKEGLREQLQVLISSYQFILGVILARRNREMFDLGNACLTPNKDPNLPENYNIEYSVIFDNRKSGDAYEREIINRPVIWYGAKIIWDLQCFFIKIAENTQTDAPQYLFNNIGITEGIIRGDLNNNLDIFCDYFETSTVKINGDIHRFYYREHQLRRFLAKAFFHSGAFGGIECLRWFLAHTDLEHTLRYVSDAIPGSALNEIKAETLVYSFNLKNIKNIEVLRQQILEKYQANSIQITTIEEAMSELSIAVENGFATVSPHIDSIKNNIKNELLKMLNNGSIDLHPEFFTIKTQDNEIETDFRLILTVKEIE
jgi:hypothetical protein